jgi:cyanophycinase-like exopeptidase
MTPGPLALVGSGEYLAVMQPVEAALIAGRGTRYVQIPTAAAPEGDASLNRWFSLGRQAADRLGVEQIPVDVRTRDDANNPDLVALIEGAGLIYLSGGNPSYLAQTLRGTALWTAIVAAWESGAALAGCSAGAMAMTGWVPSLRSFGDNADPGLGLLTHLRIIPHFDKMGRWAPDAVTNALLHPPAGVTVVGIDEDTALVCHSGDKKHWVVQGRQQVWQIADGPRQPYPAGSELELHVLDNK